MRDENANMAWAVESTVQAPSGDPRSRRDEPRAPLPAGPAPGTDLRYLLATSVPKHWIPLVPVPTDGNGGFVLRKGTVTADDEAVGQLLRGKPVTFHEEEVPREGVRVRRVPSLLRAADGSRVRWIARRVSIGHGEGSSGFAFDNALK
jgi:hypothetical protein